MGGGGGSWRGFSGSPPSHNVGDRCSAPSPIVSPGSQGPSRSGSWVDFRRLLCTGGDKVNGETMQEIFLRDIGALARARRRRTTLAAEKKDETPAAPVAPGAPIGGGLEAVRAVLPVTFLATYTAGVLAFQGLAITLGADDRAKEQAALTKKFAADPAALKDALKELSLETDKLVWLRIVYAIAMLIGLVFLAFKKVTATPVAGAPLPETPKLEPFITIAAFIAWAVAAPGTPLAAYLNAENLTVVTVSVGVFTAGVLYFVGKFVLKKAETA